MSIVLLGSTSGSITLQEPAVAGSNTISLPAVTGTVVVAGQNSAITSGTAVASTSGTSIDFTSIPSWVKRVTVMFSGVSLSASSNYLIQLGSGSVTTSGYVSAGGLINNANGTVVLTSTSGFVMRNAQGTSSVIYGHLVCTLISGNTWVESHILGDSVSTTCHHGGGNVTLSGTLDRVRITTVNGTDTFDAGTINILYE